MMIILRTFIYSFILDMINLGLLLLLFKFIYKIESLFFSSDFFGVHMRFTQFSMLEKCNLKAFFVTVQISQTENILKTAML